MLLKPDIPMQIVFPWTLTETVKKCPVAMQLHMIIEGVEQSSNLCHSFQVDHPDPGGVRSDLTHSIKTSWLSFYIAVGFSEDVGNAMWHILERKAHKAAQSMQPALPTVHFRLTMQIQMPVFRPAQLLCAPNDVLAIIFPREQLGSLHEVIYTTDQRIKTSPALQYWTLTGQFGDIDDDKRHLRWLDQKWPQELRCVGNLILSDDHRQLDDYADSSSAAARRDTQQRVYHVIKMTMSLAPRATKYLIVNDYLSVTWLSLLHWMSTIPFKTAPMEVFDNSIGYAIGSVRALYRLTNALQLHDLAGMALGVYRSLLVKNTAMIVPELFSYTCERYPDTLGKACVDALLQPPI